MRIKLIANPVSGGEALPRIRAAQSVLQELGAEVVLTLTTARGDARIAASQALAEGYDRIIAAGGDGTLNEVINGVACAELPIAFLPCGTVNVFALEAGIPFALEEACSLAVSGVPRPVTLGRVNEELFLLMVSAGWDAESVAQVRGGVKRLVGRLAYAVSALEVLLLQSPAALQLVTPDGVTHPGFGVVVSNCRYYGGQYIVTPKASMFSDKLEVCLLRQGGRLAMLRFAASLLLKRSLKPPFVDFFSLETLELRGKDVAVQVDGDAWGRLPVTIETIPRAISMILPDCAD